MKKRIIKLLLECDKKNHNTSTHPQFSPNSSIEEIAEYITEWIQMKRAMGQ